jgi:hypothetical protein
MLSMLQKMLCPFRTTLCVFVEIPCAFLSMLGALVAVHLMFVGPLSADVKEPDTIR